MADLLKEYQKMAEQAKLSNLETKAQVEAIHNEIIKRYEPGGTFLTGGEKLIQAEKRKTTGEQLHQLISSGLYGTTTPGALGAKYEEEVAAPARFKLEDVAMERLSSAQLGKASFLENIQNPYPDYNALMQASAAQRAGGTTSGQPGPRPAYGGGSVSGGFGGYAEGSAPGIAGGLTPTAELQASQRARYQPGGNVSGGTTGGGGGYTSTGAYGGIASLAGGTGGVSTMPKGTGTISGPKGTTGITSSGSFGISGDINKQIAEHQALLANASAMRLSADRIAQIKEQLALLQSQAYSGGWTG